MNILAIDTSGPVAGCAVMKDGRLIQSTLMNRGLTHSETIMPAVDEAMRSAGLTCKDIDVFAAVAGPGSFTGVRIGICTVKGMAHAVGKKCMSVDALEALAVNYTGFDAVICPILDARRSQVYCAAFDTSGGMPVRIAEDRAIAIDEFLESLPEDRKLVFLGDGLGVHAAYIKERFGNRAIIAPENMRHLRAEAACVIAQEHPERSIDAAQLVPVYLRLPQAERERNKRLEGEKV